MPPIAAGRSPCGPTLVEVLVITALIFTIAWLARPTVTVCGEEAYRLKCKHNLRTIHAAALLYERRSGAFPLAPAAPGAVPPAHESLNVLLESRQGADLRPETFVCPEGEAVLAEVDISDRRAPHFTLGPSNLSYTWISKPTRSTSRGFLSSDKHFAGQEDAEGPHAGHRGVVLAIDTDGRVLEIPSSDPLLGEEPILPGLTR